MPFLKSSTPSWANLICAPNLLSWGSIAASTDLLTSTVPTVSSEIPTFPGTNTLTQPRSEMWRTRGMFRVSDDTTRGLVFAPNDQLHFSIDGGATILQASITEADYQDPLDLAAEIKTQMEAQDLSSTYTVTHYDRRESGTAATWKWRITRDEGAPFSLIGSGDSFGDSILETLGYTDDTDFTGAATYLSNDAACHSEEYIVWKLDINTMDWTAMVKECGDTGPLSYLHLIGSNIRFGLGETLDVDGPKQQPRIYFLGGGDGSVELDLADSSYTSGTDMIVFPSTDPFPSWIGIDSQEHGGGFRPASPPTPTYHRFIQINLAEWSSDYTFGVGEQTPTTRYGTYLSPVVYVKLKISDPRHPDGYVALSNVHIGPAWTPGRACETDRTVTLVDPNDVTYNAAGVGFAANHGEPYTVLDLDFKFLGEGDSSNGTAPLIEFKRLFMRRIQDRITDADTEALRGVNSAALGVGRNFAIFIDRGFKPYIGGEQGQDSTGTYNRQGLTPGTLICTIDNIGPWQGVGGAVSMWDFSIRLREKVA